jgi:4-amino-4-deoxy-L-arabinose transferase-like glycosyltransferase
MKKKEEKDLKTILKENKYLIALIIILLFAFVLRFTYYDINKAVWWDSADYLTGAKEIFGKIDLDTYELNPKRPFFLPLLWGSIMFLGGEEKALHFSVLIFSMLAVFFTYLIGKEMYNKKIGLMSALLTAPLWGYLFHTARLLTDIVALAFWLMTAFFFWKYYKTNEKKYFYYTAIFISLSIFTRAASIINFIPLAIMMLVKERLNFFKEKKFWASILIFLIIFSPFLIWLFITQDKPIEKFTGIGGEGKRFRKEGFKISDIGDLWKNLNYVSNSILTPKIASISPNLLGLTIFLLIFYLCLDLFLGLDILIKKRYKEKKEKNDFNLDKKLFLLLWILTPYIFYSVFNPGIEDRYLFAMFPPILILFSTGILKIKSFLSIYKKEIATLAVIAILAVFIYIHISTADIIIKNKANSYAEVAHAGKWIKENTLPSDKIISASKFQNMYYSERETYPFQGKEPEKEAEFKSYLEEINPKYIVVSVFEPGFTPEWIYNYPQKHPELLTPVQAYFADPQQTQPLLIIYKYNLQNKLN